MDRPWSVRLDVTDGQGGGPAHDAGLAVVELDGQGGLGHVRSVTVRPAWTRPRATFWPATMIDAGVRGPALHPDRLGRRAAAVARPGGARAAGRPGRGERVRPGAQQLAGLEVEEHQAWRARSGPRPCRPAEDLRGRAPTAPAEADHARAGDGTARPRPLRTSDRVLAPDGFRRGSGTGPPGRPPRRRAGPGR